MFGQISIRHREDIRRINQYLKQKLQEIHCILTLECYYYNNVIWIVYKIFERDARLLNSCSIKHVYNMCQPFNSMCSFFNKIRIKDDLQLPPLLDAIKSTYPMTVVFYRSYYFQKLKKNIFY